jgi:hypothetical protein
MYHILLLFFGASLIVATESGAVALPKQAYSSSSVSCSSSGPFDLHLLRRISARTQRATDDDIRTRPEFFENALGIYDRDHVTVNPERWQRVKSSGLFSNLTAKCVVQPDLSVKMFVAGSELPSRVVTPEISARMEGSTPVVDGTVGTAGVSSCNTAIICFCCTASLHRQEF